MNLKKLVTSSSMVVLLTAVCTSYAYADQAGTITGETVNVRQSADASTKILTQLPKDAQVTILVQEDGWCKISYKDTTGWVSADYVSVSTKTAVSKAAVYGTVTGDDVNVRSKPNLDADVLTRLAEETRVEVLEEGDGWCKIQYEGTAGWVNRTYLSIKNGPTAIMMADDVNLRSKPDTDAEVMKKLYEGEKVNVLDRTGNWFKVKTLNGETGWVYSDFLKVSGQLASRGINDVVEKAKPTEEKKPEANQDENKEDKDNNDSKDDNASGSKIVTYAKKYIGTRYIYGGESPKGFDCSGFTQYVYKNMGTTLNRTAADQATQGTKVKKADLEPGDLIFFDTNGGHNRVNHVGIYVGGGRFIHASSGRTTKRVTISDLTDGFYANAYMTARRILK
jgi:cell wall-associated NlpC family hydrolase